MRAIWVRGILIGAVLFSILSVAAADNARPWGGRPVETTFVEFESGIDPNAPIRVKGKLNVPTKHRAMRRHGRSGPGLSAVVILHGSAGVDSRGDFYARALNAAGIATLEIDMWEARGVSGGGDRPEAPILTYPDAFGALGLLASDERIDPDRIGVLGFSWGGVMSLAAAEPLYAGLFGQGLTFAAHVAHYPVCWAFNRALIPGREASEIGLQLVNLTGAPVLIQVGSEDDYDNGAEPCRALAAGLEGPQGQTLVDVVEYEGAYHAWDRLQVPISVSDPFADEGSFFAPGGVIPSVEIIPDVELAELARARVVRFFRDRL